MDHSRVCPRLVASELTKVYDGAVRALDGVSFEIPNGRMTALIGRNGAGKSTMLNLLCGLIPETSGFVAVEPAGVYLGWCPQADLVDWSLTVEENILFGAQLAGLQRKRARLEATKFMELLDLGSVAHREVQEVSGGQLRRVQIARALVAEPDVLILDEPTSGLDPETVDIVFEYLAKRASEGALVLVSGHDLTAIGRFADDVLLLEDGTVRFHQSLAEFLDSRSKGDLRSAYLSDRREQ